jgi:thioredoxin-like negative regulator of GroEL
MITRNEDNIRELIDGNTHVMVQFGASWCMPCKQLKPKVEKISLESPDIVFAYIDVESSPRFCTESEVLSVPTTIGYRDSIELGRVVGNNETAVKELVEKVRSKL